MEEFFHNVYVEDDGTQTVGSRHPTRFDANRSCQLSREVGDFVYRIRVKLKKEHND